MYFVVINSLFETTSHMNFSFFFQFRRTKRVNMKDLLYLMEQEPETKKSHLLYKMYLKWSATMEEVSSSYRCLLVPKDHRYPTIILSRYWRYCTSQERSSMGLICSRLRWFSSYRWLLVLYGWLRWFDVTARNHQARAHHFARFIWHRTCGTKWKEAMLFSSVFLKHGRML